MHTSRPGPLPQCMRLVVHREYATAKRSLTKSAPLRLRFFPGCRRALVVAGVPNHDVSSPANIGHVF